MKRLTVFALLAGLLGFAALAAADDPPADPAEPPVRLKKKNKALPEVPKEGPAEPKAAEPKERPPMPGERPRGDDPPAEPGDPQADEQEVLARLARNMRSSEDRLANKELGEATRQVQRDILDDLDKLIKLSQQPPPGGGGGGDPKAQAGQQGQQQNRGGTRTSQQRQASRGQKPGQGQGRQAPGQRPQGGQGNKPQDQQASRNPGGNPGGGGDGPEGPNKIADLFKADVWGHLPETLRQEMNQYSRDKFMTKYDELIKQYYATIAEKGRRKGD